MALTGAPAAPAAAGAAVTDLVRRWPAGGLVATVVAMCSSLPRWAAVAGAAVLPGAWAAPECLPSVAGTTPGARDMAMAGLFGRLGWLRPGTEPVLLTRLSVRVGTSLQLAPAAAERRMRRHLWALDAAAADGAAVDLALAETAAAALLGRMQGVWRLPWENRYKEILWRLVVNGVRGAGGHDEGMALPMRRGARGSG